MKKILTIIQVLAVLMLTSCSAGEHMEMINNGIFGTISGSVTDTEGTPLEHISISIRFDESSKAQTFYTSSEGLFRFNLEFEKIDKQISFTITVKDIDGEENGGLFNEKTDVITLFEEDYTDFPVMIEVPPYRLTRATASENNPQS